MVCFPFSVSLSFYSAFRCMHTFHCKSNEIVNASLPATTGLRRYLLFFLINSETFFYKFKPVLFLFLKFYFPQITVNYTSQAGSPQLSIQTATTVFPSCQIKELILIFGCYKGSWDRFIHLKNYFKSKTEWIRARPRLIKIPSLNVELYMNNIEISMQVLVKGICCSVPNKIFNYSTVSHSIGAETYQQYCIKALVGWLLIA